MFRDEITGKLSKPLQKAQRIITKTRPKEYWGEVYNKKTRERETRLLGKGFEIVEEKMVLPETAAEFYAQQTKQEN